MMSLCVCDPDPKAGGRREKKVVGIRSVVGVVARGVGRKWSSGAIINLR